MANYDVQWGTGSIPKMGPITVDLGGAPRGPEPRQRDGPAHALGGQLGTIGDDDEVVSF